MLIIFVLQLCSYLLFTLPSGSQAVAKCGVSTVAAGAQARIIGGRYVTPHQYPWMVHLETVHVPVSIPTTAPYTIYKDNCGGSLINSQWVLTAAHCKPRNTSNHVEYRINGTFAMLGAHNVLSDNEHRLVIRVDQFHIHPDYNQTESSYDLALVKLTTPVDLDLWAPTIAPICLPASGQMVSNTDCLVLGWGNEATEQFGNGVLKSAPVEVLSSETCGDTWPSYRDEVELCAGGRDHKTCGGDSGGPLQCRTTNDHNYQWVVRGVVSFGDKWCNSAAPSVFTKVEYFTSWIEHTINATD